MNKLIILLIILPLISCKKADSDSPYIGKWAGVSSNDYFETHITQNTIYSYDMPMGTRAPISFKVKNKSLHYSTWDMVVKYHMINDSVMVMSNRDFSDTLYRLNDSIPTVDEIDLKDSVAFKKYATSFFVRANEFFKNLGYENIGDYLSNEFEKSEDELIEIEKRITTPITR